MSAPTAIAHYRITAKLGEGGMGALYRATDSRLNREVAIKVLPPAFAEDADRMQRFEREAQLLASLNHPHIAGIYGIEQGAIVMEFVDGAELKGPLSPSTSPSTTLARSPPDSKPRTRRASSTATSSPRTSASRPRVSSSCSTSDSLRPPNPPRRPRPPVRPSPRPYPSR